MRKIFLDIGTHNGQTLDLAISRYPDFDLFIGIEPVTSLCEEALGRCAKYRGRNIKVYNIALDDCPEDVTTKHFFFDQTPGNHHLGSSLLKEKTMRKQKRIEVKCWNVNYFFEQNFQSGDQVVMKIDVEGKEYDLFDALIGSGYLKKYVTKIFAEWHWNKVPHITQDRHKNVVFALRELGYPLRGKSKEDEFYDGF
jgi:FkbM family methyltransferase